MVWRIDHALQVNEARSSSEAFDKKLHKIEM